MKLLILLSLMTLYMNLMALSALDEIQYPLNKQGTVIILNGPSASGKSSIQNELQKLFQPLYLKTGIDTFFDQLLPSPDLSEFEQTKQLAQYTNEGELIRRAYLKVDAEDKPFVPLEIGPAGDRVISGMHFAIAAYAKRGNSVIVDYILYKPEWIGELKEALKDQLVYLIGIKAPLEVIEERERARGTSPIGHARSHYHTVHQGMIYDLELDVSKLSPKEGARLIKDFVEAHPSPSAFQQLLKR